MKSFSIITLAALFVAQTVADNSECLAECATTLFDSYESDCSKWREELPRPDLFLHCQKGFLTGRDNACDEMCRDEPNERALDSKRLDACQEFRGFPPQERIAACNDGFVAARERSKAFAHYKPKKNQGGSGGGDDKPKLSVKRQLEAKNILEQAREEAKAAFQDAKTSEL